MSRVGKQPIAFSKEVRVRVQDGVVFLESSKGKLSLAIPQNISVKTEREMIVVERKSDEKSARSLHGTIRALIANMVKGVTEGFRKEVEIVGVGYKAQMKGNDLVLNIGLSHPVEITPPSGLKISVPKPNRIIIEGTGKQSVGEFAARLRKLYPPEPYKGKGIRYAGEEVRKKLGKALAK